MKPPELRLAPECGAETLSWFLGERSSCRGTPAAPSRRGTLLSFLALQAAPQQGALRALHREASCRGRRARRRLRSEGACGAAAQQGGMCRPPALTRCLQAVRGCSARFSARRASRPDDLGLASSGGQRILASDCTRSFCVPTTCSAPLSTTLPSACAPPSLDRAPTFSHLHLLTPRSSARLHLRRCATCILFTLALSRRLFVVAHALEPSPVASFSLPHRSSGSSSVLFGPSRQGCPAPPRSATPGARRSTSSPAWLPARRPALSRRASIPLRSPRRISSMWASASSSSS
jgi:hypothetical protein